MRCGVFLAMMLSLPVLASAQEAPKTVMIHLDGFPAGAELMERSEDGRKRFAPICKEPCDVPVNADGVFRISGRKFALDDDYRRDPNGVIVRFDPGAPGRVTAGKVMLGIGAGAGGAAALLGVITLFGALGCVASEFSGRSGCGDTINVMAYTSLGLLITGGVAALIGIPLWLTGRPSIVQSPASQPQARAAWVPIAF